MELLTGQITGPVTPGESHPWFGWEFGPSVAMPLPRADIADAELGIRAGASVSRMIDRNFGLGLEAAYHYWPVSDPFKSDFNQILRNATFNSLELGGTTWRLRALSVTGHVKVLAPNRGAVRPWLRLGGGLYRIDPNTRGFSGDAGFFSIQTGPLPAFTTTGTHGALGVDFRTGPGVRLGLDVTCERVFSEHRFGSHFTAFTVGSHLLFGKQ